MASDKAQKKMSQETEGAAGEEGRGRPTLPTQADNPREPAQKAEPMQRRIGDKVSRPLEGFSPLFEFLVAISTVGTLGLLCVQTCSMKEGTRLTQESLSEARRSADAAVAAVEESRRQFDLQRKDTADAAKEERERFSATLKQQQEDAAVDQELTRESLRESQRALQIIQRARVGIESIPRYDIQPSDKDVLLEISIMNSGALTASDVRTRISFETRTNPLPDDAVVRLAPGDDRLVLLPDAGATLSIWFNNLNPEAVAAIKAEKSAFYLYGLIVYNDGFRQRRTGFCSRLNTANNGWSACFNNNWAE